jgi:hypothetical protein
MLNLHFKILLLLSLSISSSQTENVSAIHVIKGYFKDINENQWSSIDRWFVQEEAKDIKNFVDNAKNNEKKVGLFNIREARLLKLKELPYEYARQFLSYRHMKKFDKKKVYYVAVDYKVYNEDEYHINGINYFFVVLALEDNKWKIVITPHVPVDTIVSDGYGFGTKDEKTFDKRRYKFIN